MNEQQELLTMLTDSASKFLGARSHQDQSSSDWTAMADLGWLALPLPEDHGGAGLGAEEIAALTRHFGYYGYGNDYIAQAVLPARILAAVPADNADGAGLCEQLIGGSARLGLAWQEHAGELGDEMPGCQLTGDALKGYQLNGAKCFVAGATPASHWLVSAQQSGEPVMIAVESTAPGVAVKSLASSEGRFDDGFCELHFENVAIDAGKLLLKGERARLALGEALATARIALAAELEGIAAGCLDQTAEFIKTRKQFNQPIGAFQVIRHRSVDLKIAVRLAASSWRRAARQWRENAGDPDQTPWISAAKARCADSALKVCKEAIQMHGAMGFTEEAGIGRYMRAAIRCGAWLGSPARHRRILLNQLHQEFSHA